VALVWDRGYNGLAVTPDIMIKPLSVVTLVFLFGVMTYISHLRATLFFMSGLILFILPGILLLRVMVKDERLAFESEDILFVGAALGFGVSCTLTALIAYSLGFDSWAITLGLVLLIVLPLRWVRLGIRPRIGASRLGAAHRQLLSGFLIMTMLALVIPYASFGKATGKGIAFNGLHKTDLLHHLATSIELTKGIPPENPYFSGEHLHYHWLSHIFPAFIYSFSGFSILPRDIIVLTALIYTLLFVGVLFVVIRSFYSDQKIICLLMVLSLAAYGYNDIFVLGRSLVHVLSNTALKQVIWNRFFVDDWGQQYTGYSHGWFRSFFAEPHITLALSLIMSVIVISKRNGFLPGRTSVAFIQGTLMGCSIAMNSFIGILFVLSYGLFSLNKIFVNGLKRQILKPLAVMALTIVAMLGFMIFFQMVVPGHQSLTVKPYLTMLILSPLYLLIDYGPAVALAIVGLVLLLRKKGQLDDNITFLIFLGVVSLLFMFFVQYPDIGTQVIRNGGTILRLPLVILSGIAVQEIMRRGREKACMRGNRILLISLLIALPTPLLDIYRISEFDKQDEETYYISPQDYEAYRWIKLNLPRQAIVQDMPAGISGIVALGERRTCLGDWVHATNYQIGTQRVSERHKDIYRTLFHGKNINNALNVVRKYGIDYIYVGVEARQRIDSDAIEKFDQSTDHFEKVYSVNGVSVYLVKSDYQKVASPQSGT
jgi:hypothetical protein